MKNDIMARVGISVEEPLMKQFDHYISQRGNKNRSEAVRDLIRGKLTEQQAAGGGGIVGVITVVYDHHQPRLVERLLELQHGSDAEIVASQHVHLDHHHCLETIIVRGPAAKVEKLQGAIAALKGVGQCLLSRTSCQVMHAGGHRHQ
jgi:CopG family transcriptional regulator, nickel-responsive regulator